MKERLIRDIEQAMLPYLDNAQLKRLQSVLENVLWDKVVSSTSISEECTDALFRSHPR